jgi:hypothetical protein
MIQHVRRTVPIHADVEMWVQAIGPLTLGAPIMLDVRLHRRGMPGTALTPTAAGFRVPAHMAELVADAIRTSGRRAVEAAAMAPLPVEDALCPR